MEQNKNIKKGIVTGIIACSLMLVGFLGSYAYFIGQVGQNKNQEVTVETGTMALTFSDGNNGFNKELNFGESAEKTFTIENTGSLKAFAKINFEDLVNTYIEGSLTYTLSYSETEKGIYQEIVTNENVPRSENFNSHILTDSLVIPARTKYYYKLTIILNYLEEIDQTADLDAFFSTHFKLEQGLAKYLITFKDGINTDTTKEVIENTTY